MNVLYDFNSLRSLPNCYIKHLVLFKEYHITAIISHIPTAACLKFEFKLRVMLESIPQPYQHVEELRALSSIDETTLDPQNLL